MTESFRIRDGAIEVNIFDQQIGGDDRVTIRPRTKVRRVVADADKKG